MFQWTHLQGNATNNWKQGFYNGCKEAVWFWNDYLRCSEGNDFGDEISQELGYNFIALQQKVTELIPQLLPEQSHVFHQVVSTIESGNGAVFFLDAPGGTGKTFLLIFY